MKRKNGSNGSRADVSTYSGISGKTKNIYIRYDRYLLMGVRFLGTMFGLSVLLEIGTYWSPNMSLPLWMMLLVSGACALLLLVSILASVSAVTP